jgi:hypothetical protein
MCGMNSNTDEIVASFLNKLVPPEGAVIGVRSAEEGCAVAIALCSLGLVAVYCASFAQTNGKWEQTHAISVMGRK